MVQWKEMDEACIKRIVKDVCSVFYDRLRLFCCEMCVHISTFVKWKLSHFPNVIKHICSV